MFDVKRAEASNVVTGSTFVTDIIVDTNGLGRDLGVEQVVYRLENGEEVLSRIDEFEVVKEEGNVLTYELKDNIKDAGVFRFGYRIYPKNAELPSPSGFRVHPLDIIRRSDINNIQYSQGYPLNRSTPGYFNIAVGIFCMN